ncbi:CehA/McbA family metallohydrolase [Rubinisphaera margarita]|uniref:CehA/McbA family metallohydrolase n=1 Tax=Rubinisphaera margarita TaxID=2909586 RepID=UPI001EE87218|nr:CehA/McbA family metallohydrolase [Rubinisphaera margarita]MCG6158055.1 CehA/McbA family metallohydrolase [Rubinisphaera margarita]
MRADFLRSIAFLAIGLISTELIEAGPVEVFRIGGDNWGDVVPDGKEVDAIHGDFVLRNDHVVAVVAQPLATRNANMTTHAVGGCLIDYTTRLHPADQLTAYYPGSRVYPFRSVRLRNAAHESLEFDDRNTFSDEQAIELTMIAPGAEDRAEMLVTYRLEADSPHLIVRQTFRNSGKSEVDVLLSDDLRYDAGKEDSIKAANGKSDLFYTDDRYWGQAYGVSIPGRTVTSRSDSRTSVLRYGRGSRQPDVTLKPGEQYSLEVNLLVAGNTCTLRNLHASTHDDTPVASTITITGGGRRIPNARVELTRDGDYYGTLWADGSGRIDQKLLQGDYALAVSFCGVPVGASYPFEVSEESALIDLEVPLEVGTLEIDVDGADGTPLPCKVELRRRGESTPLDLGPESAIRQVKNLLYLPRGKENILLPAGDYEAIISHGPEFDAAFMDVAVKADGTTRLTAQLERTVDTTGWVSTEFHSHSSPSGDNTSHQMGRVLNLLCEHLEYAPCTEHNRIDTYAPHLKTLKIEDLLATCTGMELTGKPLPLNHQNVFPLKHHPGQQDGGAPVTDDSPETQLQRVALWDDRSEKVVQQNHPDLGWLFYDKNGDGVKDEGHAQSFPYIDCIEIHPPSAVLKIPADLDGSTAIPNSNRVFNWLQLLNQGYRFTGVVNTDAHYNFHGSGGLRNWVKCSTDVPSEIKTDEIVEQVTRGCVIMSNGPFLTVEARPAGQSKGNPVLPGGEFACPDGKVALAISVQCPNWFDIDRVFVLANGKHVPELDLTREKNADMFGDGAVKFRQTLNHEFPADTHLVVVAAGENSQLGSVLGTGWGSQQPTAISNPIFVDVDGNGFAANNDVLDDGLPVKQQ